MENVKSFEDLEAYKACREFRRFISSQITPKLITAKDFDLTSQLRRSSRSVTANIAEGYGRYHYLDNSKFCSNARGSLYESLEHLITAYDDQIISDSDLAQARSLHDHAAKILNGYITYLFKAANRSKC